MVKPLAQTGGRASPTDRWPNRYAMEGSHLRWSESLAIHTRENRRQKKKALQERQPSAVDSLPQKREQAANI